MKLVKVSVWFIILVSCSERETKLTYYENGIVKTKTELIDGTIDGTKAEFYSDGSKKSTQKWKNGKLNGQSINYYTNGNIGKKAMYTYGKLVGKVELFYETGEPLEIQYADSAGRIIDFERFSISGEKLDVHVPIFYTSKDTVSFGEDLDFIVKLSNFNNSFESGRLLIGQLDVNENNEILGFKDTLAIIRSDSNLFRYTFRAEKRGVGYVQGQLNFVRSGLLVDSLISFTLSHPYFVR